MLSVSSWASTMRIVSSTSTRNLRGVEPTSSVQSADRPNMSHLPCERRRLRGMTSPSIVRGFEALSPACCQHLLCCPGSTHRAERAGTAVHGLSTIVLCGLGVDRSGRRCVAIATVGGRGDVGVNVDNALRLVRKLAYQLLSAEAAHRSAVVLGCRGRHRWDDELSRVSVYVEECL